LYAVQRAIKQKENIMRKEINGSNIKAVEWNAGENGNLSIYFYDGSV